MRCPHCQSSRLTVLKQPTELGYRRFQCRACRRTYNERTGTPFNFLEYPTDLVCLVVLWRLRYTLSLRDVVELCLLRGVELTHETVRDWEQRFAPYLTSAMKQRRRGKCSSRWHVDETYVKVRGQWVYYYRAIDRDGNLVDTMMSATRSKKAAIRFFRQAQQTTGVKPTCVTTDKLASYRKAIRKACGRKVVHRTSKYLNNRLEQDHRGIKRRYGPTLGFKSFDCAATFCTAVDEARQLLRPRTTMKETLSLAQGRAHFQHAVTDFQQIFLSCPVADARRKSRLAA
jgi:transposase-like protein